ncbi:hypothetical protein [Klebsiella oxytoca]|uniref:hypothetical protein n=1 Tax=Klebsiella oxytoca TaxID=571 RepID=UPI00190E883B|nr:hypothetical protein [Klebsiella oxytoca]
MLSLSGTVPLNLDSERTTDGVTTVYTVPLTGFSDGAVVKGAVSLTTSTEKNCSYEITIHKHNNIGGKVAVVSSYAYGSLSINFSMTFTTLTITLSEAIVGNLKIALYQLNY